MQEAEGSIGRRAMACGDRSGGVCRATARTYGGSPGNLGDLVVSVIDTRQRKFTGVAIQIARAGRAVSARHGANHRHSDGRAGAKATKRPATGGEKSDHLVVPTKPGNRPDGTRRREGDGG